MKSQFKLYPIALFVILLSVFLNAEASPVVIKDYGGKNSGYPSDDEVKQIVSEAHAKNIKPVISSVFPVVSKIRSGVIEQSINHEVNIVSPIFIVGNDDLSVDWLTKNKAYLQKIGAAGYATNIKNQADFRALEELAAPIRLTPVCVDEIAKLIKLRSYPVLITKEKAEQ